MSKRTSVLTVIISSILFLVTFFAVFYSNTVLADKTASIAFYKDSSGSFCFLPEKVAKATSDLQEPGHCRKALGLLDTPLSQLQTPGLPGCPPLSD